VFIVSEQTPNPDAMKFVPHVQLTDGAAFAFTRTGFDPSRSPLAARLFALADIVGVYVAPEFVTVTRSPTGRPWPALRLAAIAAIADHLESGAEAVSGEAVGDAAAAPTTATEEDIESEIRSVLHLWVKPGVARDGGDILFDRFDAATGVLWIRMQGACGGCPSSRLTLKAGVERIVRRYVPEVLGVEETVDVATAPARSRLESWLASLPARSGPEKRPIFTYGSRLRSEDRDSDQPAPPPLSSEALRKGGRS
jgi:Fe-S cluster biogenesis protein NfuA